MREEERQTAASVTKHTLTTNGTQNKQTKKTGQGKQTFAVVCVRERDMCELVKNLLDNLTS